MITTITLDAITPTEPTGPVLLECWDTGANEVAFYTAAINRTANTATILAKYDTRELAKAAVDACRPHSFTRTAP